VSKLSDNITAIIVGLCAWLLMITQRHVKSNTPSLMDHAIRKQVFAISREFERFRDIEDYVRVYFTVVWRMAHEIMDNGVSNSYPSSMEIRISASSIS
jgi:hypothetical protein